MPEDLMRYDLMAQEALRGVVRAALLKVIKTGLPGEHHFYISFNTRYPGARISERIRQKYPREMTIVLQHQYRNLSVHDDRFEVELSFDNISEKLIVPFGAIKGFLDPSVQFGLHFEVVTIAPTAPAEAEPPALVAVAAAEAKPEEPNDAPKVVSLDAFRKK